MKELIVNAVALGYKPLFYTKRGTINAMAKKLEKLTVERCKPLELFCLQQWLREGRGIDIVIHVNAGWNGWMGTIYQKKKNYFVSASYKKTYEEALYEGLKEGVKLVEN